MSAPDRPWEAEDPNFETPEQRDKKAKWTLGLMMAVVLTPIVLFVLLLVIPWEAFDGAGDDDADPSLSVSRSAFEAEGKTWPLTVDEGTIVCGGANKLIIRAGGGSYALNGLAKQSGVTALDYIWADNPDVDGLKIDASDLTNAGLEFCGY